MRNDPLAVCDCRNEALLQVDEEELRSLGASIRFKPLWLEDLIALAKTLVSA